MAETKTKAQIDAFVADLRKTKGGVSVTEAGDETIIRTRDGDDYRFHVARGKGKAE